jgi:hypothetical protein
MSNHSSMEVERKSKLLIDVRNQILHCTAQGYTESETAQAVIDLTADWFQDTINQIGMPPAVIPTLLRWQAHQHEYLD